MQVVSRTHVGLVRENNEDALLVREPYLFAVADGMGGYAAGEIASRSTVKAFEAATYSLRHEMGEQDIRKIMLDAFDKANTHVFKMAVSNEQYTGMGTTMTANSAIIAIAISDRVSTIDTSACQMPPRFGMLWIMFSPWISDATPARAAQSASISATNVVQPSVPVCAVMTLCT